MGIIQCNVHERQVDNAALALRIQLQHCLDLAQALPVPYAQTDSCCLRLHDAHERCTIIAVVSALGRLRRQSTAARPEHWNCCIFTSIDKMFRVLRQVQEHGTSQHLFSNVLQHRYLVSLLYTPFRRALLHPQSACAHSFLLDAFGPCRAAAASRKTPRALRNA